MKTVIEGRLVDTCLHKPQYQSESESGRAEKAGSGIGDALCDYEAARTIKGRVLVGELTLEQGNYDDNNDDDCAFEMTERTRNWLRKAMLFAK